MTLDSPITKEKLLAALSSYPNDTELTFITVCEKWGASLRIAKPSDPNTEQEIFDSNELWITVD